MEKTKQPPLRQSNKSEEGRQAAKDAIREAYQNGPQREVRIIPAKHDIKANEEAKKLRVCAYCRVSTDEEAQLGSHELQVQNYTKMIKENPAWEFAGIYADEGISGTSVQHRKEFIKMIDRCKAGEIDLIITKQVSRFARNVLDSLNYIYMLRKLDPPVGVYFETEKLNTLDKSSDMVITVLSLVAQSESEQKSNSMKWSYRRRSAQGIGIYPIWSLYGYTVDANKNWVIVEEEAKVVRLIFRLYLEGCSAQQIADFLNKRNIPTARRAPSWRGGGVMDILSNEKYCGDALCQKTVTVDFFTHRTIKNNGIEPQYLVEEHHMPIINKADWLRAQKIREENRYQRIQKKRKRRVVAKGALAGFVIIDPGWSEEEIGIILAPVVNEPGAETNPTIEKETIIN